jgi:hypothetical protein
VTPGNKNLSSLYLMIVPGAAGCSPASTMIAEQSATLAATLGAWIDAGAPQQ